MVNLSKARCVRTPPLAFHILTLREAIDGCKDERGQLMQLFVVDNFSNICESFQLLTSWTPLGASESLYESIGVREEDDGEDKEEGRGEEEEEEEEH